jgi:hypothetical protein
MKINNIVFPIVHKLWVENIQNNNLFIGHGLLHHYKVFINCKYIINKSNIILERERLINLFIACFIHDIGREKKILSRKNYIERIDLSGINDSDKVLSIVRSHSSVDIENMDITGAIINLADKLEFNLARSLLVQVHNKFDGKYSLKNTSDIYQELFNKVLFDIESIVSIFKRFPEINRVIFIKILYRYIITTILGLIIIRLPKLITFLTILFVIAIESLKEIIIAFRTGIKMYALILSPYFDLFRTIIKL